MYKVLIVDDERIIRIALKSMINWESEGFTVCGTASCSSSALEIIHDQHPDLIITDIVMPEISGIDFIKLIRQQGFSEPIIILSNYNDFNYAVEALHNNVFDYMLKTDISPESLVLVLKKVKSFLDQNSSQTTAPPATANQDSFLLNEVISNKEFSAELFSDTYFFLEIFLRNKVLRKNAEINIPNNSLKHLIQEIPLFSNYLTEELSKDSLIILIPQNDQTTFLSSFVESKNKIRELINLYMNTDCGFVCSNPFNSPYALVQKLDQLTDAEQLVLYEGFYNIIKEDNVHLYKRDSINLALLFLKIQNYIADEDYRECKRVLSETFLDLKQKKVHVSTVLEILSKLYSFMIFDNSIYLEHVQERLQDIALHYHKCCTLDEYLTLLGELINLIDSQKAQLNSASLRKEIQLVNKYIEENINQKINLSMLAKQCNISENYLSRLFKSETGTNIITYINNKKMQRAKELLAHPQYTIKEISAFLGFDEPAYFNKIFNKTYNVNPSDYRKLIQSSYTDSSEFVFNEQV